MSRQVARLDEPWLVRPQAGATDGRVREAVVTALVRLMSKFTDAIDIVPE